MAMPARKVRRVCREQPRDRSRDCGIDLIADLPCQKRYPPRRISTVNDLDTACRLRKAKQLASEEGRRGNIGTLVLSDTDAISRSASKSLQFSSGQDASQSFGEPLDGLDRMAGAAPA